MVQYMMVTGKEENEMVLEHTVSLIKEEDTGRNIQEAGKMI